MAQKKKTAVPKTSAERMRLYRQRRADAGQVNYAATIPGSAARRLDSKAGTRGLTRAEYLVEMSRSGVSPSPVSPPKPPTGGGSRLMDDARMRRAVKGLLKVRDGGARLRRAEVDAAIDRALKAMRLALPAGRDWDDLIERL